MKTTVSATVREDKYFILMDKKINNLRKAIWRAIHEGKGGLSDCDISMALGLVQYELIHHVDDQL